ncbi:Gamma-aminobutyric acid receptor subunit rho-3 [Chionoecetes opilio]|uniref:Gamma-aminobutyric acid receptor subunit rho-3 n=1 Tax=Chionoecetes opilio TaxID=41210 RepID=A0A8J4YTN9_CHIOP|nr:Gamma-aminobutyric acid receptor subunit rho-3 [Chionoecetes opilio]
MDRVVLPQCLLLVLLLLILGSPGTSSTVHVYEFQAKGQQSDSFLLYSKNLTFPPLNALTFCVRLRFYFLWEVSGFLQVSDDSSGKLVPTIQAEVNLNYIRVTLANFRRYHFLKSRLRALTWHHLCLTYGEGVTVSYLDGAEQDRHLYELGQNITGNHAKVGAWDAASSYSGQLAQVNLWSRALTPQEVAGLAECRVSLEGDLMAWGGPWDIFGNVSMTEEPSDKLCQEASGTDYFIFTDFTAPAAFQVCEGLGGYVPTPQSRGEYETIVQAVEMYHKNGEHTCKRFWAGITDQQEEGVWTLVKHMSKLEPPWAVDEPDGSNLENCAVVEGPLQMADARCDEQQCVVCAVPRRPVWKLLGACERYHRNTHFVALQDANEGFLFRGYSDYRMVRDRTHWLWWDWRNNETVASLSNGVNGVPIGRQNWTLKRAMCGQTEGEKRRLLLTPCPSDFFSCDDASCIRLYQRCDLKFDCRDKSDESGCQLVRFPPIYRPDLPPVVNSRNNESSPLPVTVRVIIESADVDTPSMHMHVNLNVSMTWQEARLNFLNLNEDYTLNRVPYETMRKVWVPVIDFTNTKGIHITQTDHQATMVVNMHGKPKLGDETRPEELEVYPGPENPMSVRRKYSITFQCQFHLKMYPFDEQFCHLELTMLSASSRLLVFDEVGTAAIFEGNPNLVEYFVGDVDIDFRNDRDFAVMFVKLQLLRRSGFIIMNVYIPSLLLLVISYLTLYFTPTNFQVRVLASLTSLLVMATLFTQASSSLPKTSYFKMVDVWLLSSIFFIFIIIVLHTIIDRVREWEPTAQVDASGTPPRKLGETTPASSEKSCSSSTVHPTAEVPREATGPTDVEEPSQKWWDTMDLCMREAVAWIPKVGRRQRRQFEKMILGARVLVLCLLVVFNIVYWTLVLV